MRQTWIVPSILALSLGVSAGTVRAQVAGGLPVVEIAPQDDAPEKAGTSVPMTGSREPRVSRVGSVRRGQGLGREVEPNGTAVTATLLGGSSAVLEGNVFPNGDVDFYVFAAGAGDRVYAATMTSLSANASVDSVLDLLATDGTTVLETDNDDGSFGATSSSIAGFTIPSAGSYYLRVRHNVGTSQLRPYRLYFQLRTGAPTAEIEPNDTLPGQGLPAGGWVSGSTSATTDVDLYSVALNAGDTVFLSLDLDPERDTTEWNAQLGLGPFGAGASILVVNDAGTLTPDSEAYFMTVSAAGNYSVFVGVPAGGTTFGTYHLSVTVFPAVDEGVACTTYTSTDVPSVIPTGPGIITSTLNIPGNPRIADLDVSIQLTHDFMADLDAELTAPGGNTVGLFTDIGSAVAGVQTTMDVTLDDEAGAPIGLYTIVQGLTFAPELAYRLSWFDGQPAGGTWTLTLRDDAAGDGGTLTGWSIRVCEPPPAATCAAGYAPTTVYATDFESGAAGFTHSGTLDEWEIGLPTFAPVTGCNSGANCFKTDLDSGYNASSDQELLSAPIDLTGLSGPVVVTWAQKYQMESATFDTMLVEMREVGAPANAIRFFDWLGATMTNTVGNPSTTTQEAAGWGLFSARADDLAGLNTELSFRLTSDTTVQLAGLAIDDVTVTACLPLPTLAITKTDGLAAAVAGQATTYTIVASNAGPGPAPAATVNDTFPAAFSGAIWTCIAAGGATCTAAGAGNLADAVSLPAGGSVTYTVQGTISAAFVGVLSNTASVDDGGTPVEATDVTQVSAPALVTGTKTVSGAFVPGGAVVYTIVLTNSGGGSQLDNPGDEFTDVVPAPLVVGTVGASSGTAGAAGNTVTWNGSIPSGGSVTITIQATISSVDPGLVVSNQGSIAFDADGNGTNESATVTDDPGTATSGDATAFAIAAESIPSLSTLGLLALAAALALAGAWRLR